MKLNETEQKFVSQLLERYGDFVFDFAYSLVGDPHLAQIVFKTTLKSVLQRAQGFDRYERPMVIQEVVHVLRKFRHRLPKPSHAVLKSFVDAKADAQYRLRHLDVFIRRLSFDDRCILLLREKYGFLYSEISSALEIPEEALKLRRQQCMKRLTEWIWGDDEEWPRSPA